MKRPVGTHGFTYLTLPTDAPWAWLKRPVGTEGKRIHSRMMKCPVGTRRQAIDDSIRPTLCTRKVGNGVEGKRNILLRILIQMCRGCGRRWPSRSVAARSSLQREDRCSRITPLCIKSGRKSESNVERRPVRRKKWRIIGGERNLFKVSLGELRRGACMWRSRSA